MEGMSGAPESHAGWTFITNHARVLATIAEDSTVRIRDIAARCRLTERAVQRIIADLEQDGYLSHTREGRANTYRIEPDKVLRHPRRPACPWPRCSPSSCRTRRIVAESR